MNMKHALTTRILAMSLAGIFAISTPIILTGCATSNPIVVNQNTIAAIINLVVAFTNGTGVVNLTPDQLVALEGYLSSTKNIDVLVLIQMLVLDGVIPTGTILTPTQLAAMIGLLDTLGFLPVINGQAPTVEQLAPEKAMRYQHDNMLN